ncbi:MAG: glycosyltransferase [Elusimicrobiaceae bacterium]|nr:glycosyltransferase [Elusimicrobiaceae bacterium]
MKILYVITSTETGGAEKALQNLVRFMRKDNTVKVICLKPLGAVGKELMQEGIEVVSLQMQGAGLGTVAKLVQEIQKFQPDIVHALLFRAIEFSRLACAGRGIKLITTPHFDLSQKPLWMRWLDRFLKGIDTVSTAESTSTYSYLLQKQHYRKINTFLIGNSIEKTQFFKDNSLRTSMRRQYRFTPQDVVFVSVARLSPVKNPRGLLAAFLRMFGQCPQAKLVYVGDGPERQLLEKEIEKNKLKDHVFLAGEQQNVNAWLNMADVFVLFSKEESLPLALLEAKQVGLPCVVSNVGDMPAQIEHGKNGFVCKTADETLLTCLLAELYANASLRQQMSNYSLQKTAIIQDSSQQYQQLYQQIVGNEA